MPDPMLTEIAELEQVFHHADRERSAEQLERLLHPDFWEIGKSGCRYSRTQVLAHLVGQHGHTPAHSSGFELTRLADDAVLLTYESRHEEADAVIRVARSSIWMHAPGGWRIRYHQGTKVPS